MNVIALNADVYNARLCVFTSTCDWTLISEGGAITALQETASILLSSGNRAVPVVEASFHTMTVVMSAFFPAWLQSFRWNRFFIIISAKRAAMATAAVSCKRLHAQEESCYRKTASPPSKLQAANTHTPDGVSGAARPPYSSLVPGPSAASPSAPRSALWAGTPAAASPPWLTSPNLASSRRQNHPGRKEEIWRVKLGSGVMFRQLTVHL